MADPHKHPASYVNDYIYCHAFFAVVSRYREPLQVLVGETLRCLVCLTPKVIMEGLFHAPPLLTAPPLGPIKALLRWKLDVPLFGIVVPFVTNMRMPWQIPMMLMEAACHLYVFSYAGDLGEMLWRFGGASLLGLGLSWWWDWGLRKEFLDQRLRRQQEQEEGQKPWQGKGSGGGYTGSAGSSGGPKTKGGIGGEAAARGGGTNAAAGKEKWW